MGFMTQAIAFAWPALVNVSMPAGELQRAVRTIPQWSRCSTGSRLPLMWLDCPAARRPPHYVARLATLDGAVDLADGWFAGITLAGADLEKVDALTAQAGVSVTITPRGTHTLSPAS